MNSEPNFITGQVPHANSEPIIFNPSSEYIPPIGETPPNPKHLAQFIYSEQDKAIFDDIKNRNGISLMTHQSSTIRMMEEIEQTAPHTVDVTNNATIRRGTTLLKTTSQLDAGIISNAIGSGKTYCVLGLLARDLANFGMLNSNYWYIQTRYGFEHGLNVEMKYASIYLNSNVIIVPTTIHSQWARELKKFNIDFVSISTADEEKQIKEQIQKLFLANNDEMKESDSQQAIDTGLLGINFGEDELIDRMNKLTITPETKQLSKVILCSSSFSNWVSEYKFKRIIIDEFNTVSRSARSIRDLLPNVHASFIWLSQHNIYHGYNRNTRLQVLYYNLHNMQRVEIPSRFITTEQYTYTTHRYIIPQNVICNKFKDLLGEELIEKLVEQSYESEDNIIEYQKAKYRREILRLTEELNVEDITVAAIERINKEIAKNENNIKNLDARLREVLKDADCNICYDEITKFVITNCCNNILCGSCVKTIIRNNASRTKGFICPYCKTVTTEPANMIIYDNTKKEEIKEEKEYKEESKEESIVEIVQPTPDHIVSIIRAKPTGKFIIASDSAHTNFIADFLKTAGFKVGSIIGKTAKDQGALLKRFANSDQTKRNNINVLLLSLEKSAAGSNLQFVSDIILYNPIVSERVRNNTKAQILGRALRKGREINFPLRVHEFAYHNLEISP